MVVYSKVLLSVSSLSFSVSLSLAWMSSASLSFAEAISSPSSFRPMNFPHYPRSRKYFLHFGSVIRDL